MRAVVLLAAVGALALAGVGVAAHDPPPRSAFAVPKLFPLPRSAANQCTLAQNVGVCPRRLPRPTIAYRAAPLPRLMVERYRPGRNGTAVMAGISFSYGAPWEPGSSAGWRHHVWRNRPCCFLHFEVWRAVSGVPPMPDSAGPALVAGRRGTFAPATAWGMACGVGNEGVWFCNHLRFRCRERGSWYVATRHRFGTGRDARNLLDRLIRELRPA